MHFLMINIQMRLLIFVSIILLTSCVAQSQIDTLRLKNQVDRLNNKDSIQAYLNHILQEDQHYRGDLTNLSMDIEHLISLSYFINKFTFPTEEIFGPPARALRFVWTHVPFLSLKKFSFPLIHSAFLTGHISENDLRTYYLKRLYEDEFDDEKNLSLPIDSLFVLLKLNTTSRIPIHILLLEAEKIKDLRSMSKKETWKWSGSVKSKVVTANGNRVLMTSTDSPVEIFTLENCNIYFRKLHSDNSYEPKELVKIGEGKYKIKNQQTNKYFEIKENGNLIYTDGFDIIYEYRKLK